MKSFYVILSVLSISLLASLVKAAEPDTETQEVVFEYKKSVTLDCSNKKDVEFYMEPHDINKTETETKIEQSDKFNITDGVLVINDVRGDQIKANYTCKQNGIVFKTFVNRVAPYIFKPDKPSVTVTEGGNVELKCIQLFGENVDLKWVWRRSNGTEISSETDERYSIDGSQSNQTTLTISRVVDSDKGEYECELRNKFGSHTEKIQLRVKDAFAALWPFLAIVVEVILLCLIILIYEKKCSKKRPSSEEENEQAQNLMGRDGQNSDLKKRSAVKA